MYSEGSAADDADNKEIDEGKTAVDRTDIELYSEQLWQVRDSVKN